MTCFVIVHNSSEQDDRIHINTMSMVVDLLAVAHTLSSNLQIADNRAAPLVADIATSPWSKLFTASEELVSI